jgi:hypothetical protein
MEEGAAVLPTTQGNRDPITGMNPPVGPDRPLGLCFKIGNKVGITEMETRVTLEYDGRPPALAAGYVWQSDQPLFPA